LGGLFLLPKADFRGKPMDLAAKKDSGFLLALLSFLNRIALFLIFFMAIWMCTDVVSRYIFNSPIPGTAELVKSLLPAIVFLSFAYTLRKKRNVRVEIITDHFSAKGKNVIDVIDSLFGVMVFSLVTIYSLDSAWAGWLVKEYEGVQLKVPVYPIRFIVAFGAALFTLEFFLRLLEAIRSLSSKPGKETC
jgi:TRAP-type mannitol/chloroaromatic compound transport system permease small subunit